MIKKSNLTIWLLAAAIGLILLIPGTASAKVKSITNSEGVITVKGKSDNLESGVNTTINVYAPGYDNEDIENVSGDISEFLEYRDQITTDANGEYRFDFSPGHGEGIYKIYVGDVISGNVQGMDYVYTEKSFEDYGVTIDNAGGFITISGYAESKTLGVKASIDVYAPGYTRQDIIENPGIINTALEYRNQMYTDHDGKYEFKLEPKNGEGAYTIYIACDDSGRVMTMSYYYLETSLSDILVDTEAVGNIFSDSKKPEFNLSLKNTSCFDDTFKVEWTVTEDDNVIISKTENVFLKRDESKQITVNPHVNRYGIFDLSITVSGMGDFSKTVNTRFSYVNENESLNPEVGIQSDWDGGYHANPELLKKAGLSFVRDEMRWYRYEKIKGEYIIDSSYKRYFDSMNEKGIGLFQILGFSNPDVYGENPPKTDAGIEAFGNYCYNLALDLVGTTNDFEVWNEPNHTSVFFDGTAAEYAHIVIEANKRVKEANPNARIWVMSTGGVDHDYITDVLKELAKTPGKHFDGITVHPYKFNSIPESGTYWKPGYGSTQTIVQVIDDIKQIASSYGYEDVPVIASEYGYSSNLERDNVSEFQQAQYLARALTHFKANSLFERVSIFRFQNIVSDSIRENNLGIVNNKNSEIPYMAKPAYLAVSNYNVQLNGAEFVSNYSSGDFYNYKFKNNKGNDLYVLWNVSGNVTKAMFFDGTVKLMDMYGNASYPKCESGNEYDILIGESPVYIEILPIAPEKAELIYEKSEDKIYCEATVDTDLVSGDFVLMCAFYRQGQLVKVECETGNTFKTAKIQKEIVADFEYDSAKLMLASGYDHLTPLIAAVEIN